MDQVVTDLVRCHVFARELVHVLGHGTDQFGECLHLADGRVNDRVEGSMDEPGHERGEVDLITQGSHSSRERLRRSLSRPGGARVGGGRRGRGCRSLSLAVRRGAPINPPAPPGREVGGRVQAERVRVLGLGTQRGADPVQIAEDGALGGLGQLKKGGRLPEHGRGALRQCPRGQDLRKLLRHHCLQLSEADVAQPGGIAEPQQPRTGRTGRRRDELRLQRDRVR